MDHRRQKFRDLLAREDLVICPGVFNALFARLAEQARFELIYSTGAGIANAHLGSPDLGLLTMTELVEINRRIASTVDIPVLADIDTGYGGALNVYRTVQEFEAAGVAGVQIEDQVNPKRCGHFANKRVVERGEMLERIVAAREARRDPAFVIVARTDAIATDGIAEAIVRSNLCVAAGADVIFVEAPTSVEDMARIPSEIHAPVLINMVEGGLTPNVQPSELKAMGYRVALYANTVLRSALWAVSRALEVLNRTKSTEGLLDTMVSWDERQALVEIDRWNQLNAAIGSGALAVLTQRTEP